MQQGMEPQNAIVAASAAVSHTPYGAMRAMGSRTNHAYATSPPTLARIAETSAQKKHVWHHGAVSSTMKVVGSEAVSPRMMPVTMAPLSDVDRNATAGTKTHTAARRHKKSLPTTVEKLERRLVTLISV